MKLHIGGTQAKEGWKILNSQPGPNVDYIGDIRDLSFFENECCEEVYGAHVLEHIGQKDMIDTLKGIRRLLKPNGKLMISVPDLDVLCKLFIHPELNASQRFHVMRMMFGGQVDPWDFHYIGLNFEILGSYLSASGFGSCARVDSFNLFNDTSSYAPYGVPISLNVIAEL
jgi:predicted SAM-dependent methyltransferase